jgi:hypothetical protein
MKITVELSESELNDVLRFSGEKKKGPAIRKFIVSELMLRRRRELTEKVLAGELSADLPPIAKLRKDRRL